MAAAARAPHDAAAVGAEGRIPVFGGVVGDLPHLAAPDVDRPEIEVPAAIRGEDHRDPRARVGRLPVAAVPLGEQPSGPVGRLAGEGDLFERAAPVVLVEDHGRIRYGVETYDVEAAGVDALHPEHSALAAGERLEPE